MKTSELTSRNQKPINPIKASIKKPNKNDNSSDRTQQVVVTASGQPLK